MSNCPTCGQPVRPTDINGPDELLAILNTPRTDRDARHDVYKGCDGSWSVTYRGGRVAYSAVRSLLERGLIRRTYSSCDDCYTSGPTIDCDATKKARKKNRRAPLVYLECESGDGCGTR